MPTQLILADRRELSPLLTIWTQPRQTAEYVASSTSWLLVSTFAALSGLSAMLYLARAGAALDKLAPSLALPAIAVAGVVLGLVRLFFGAHIVAWLARRLGGTGSYRATCEAFAWGAVPQALSLLVQLVLFVVAGAAYLQASATTSLETNVFFVLSSEAYPFLVLWSVVATTNALSQLHSISGARALFALVVGDSLALSASVLLILAPTALPPN